MPSEAQIKNSFISQKNYVLFSRYSSFCIFNNPMIYQVCDLTMRQSAFSNIFWTTTHEVTNFDQLIDKGKGNNLQ